MKQILSTWAKLSILQKLSAFGLVVVAISFPLAILSISQATNYTSSANLKNPVISEEQAIQEDLVNLRTKSKIDLKPTRAIKPKVSDCRVGGCNGELCLNPNDPAQVSICQYKEVYACYHKFGTCTIQADTQRCGWTPTADLNTCLQSYSSEEQAAVFEQVDYQEISQKPTPSPKPADTSAKPTTAPITNRKCIVSGCNNEVCQKSTSDIGNTICKYDEKFACYQQFGSCVYQEDLGECGWTQTPELANCLNSYAKPYPSITPTSTEKLYPTTQLPSVYPTMVVNTNPPNSRPLPTNGRSGGMPRQMPVNPSNQYQFDQATETKENCIPRPACLSATPPCQINMMINPNWCPEPTAKIIPTPIPLPTPARSRFMELFRRFFFAR